MTDLGKLLHYHSFSEGIFPDIILNEKKRSEETQTLCAGCSKAEPNFFRPAADPLPGARDGQHLISWRCMVTTFTYRPSLVRIDARNFELSW